MSLDLLNMEVVVAERTVNMGLKALLESHTVEQEREINEIIQCYRKIAKEKEDEWWKVCAEEMQKLRQPKKEIGGEKEEK